MSVTLRSLQTTPAKSKSIDN